MLLQEPCWGACLYPGSQQQHSAHPGVRVAAAGGGGADYASEGEDGDGDGDLHRSLARFQASLPKYYQQI